MATCSTGSGSLPMFSLRLAQRAVEGLRALEGTPAGAQREAQRMQFSRILAYALSLRRNARCA